MELKLQKSTAKQLYPVVPDWFQKVLSDTFGTELFKKRTFEDIKTFEDACEELGIDPEAVIHKNDTPDEAAYKKLKIVIKAINKDWVPDWNDNSQRKWWPYFNLSSGSGFSYSGSDYGYEVTNVSSRLCTDSSEKAEYIAEQFAAEYVDYFLYSE